MLLSVEEAQARIVTDITPLDPVEMALDSLMTAAGQAEPPVLAEDVHSQEDIPPFANSSMDGFAVQAASTAGATPQAPRYLQLIGEAAAGHPFGGRIGPGQAVRIMTGAPLPEGADAVVEVEWTRATTDPSATVAVEHPVTAGRNIRRAGEDIGRGSLVLPRGTPLYPPQVGILATLGRVRVAVFRAPRVALLSTGDELVNPDQPLGPGQIRNANAFALAAAVARAGGWPLLLPPAPDREEAIAAALEQAVAQADVVLSSGGVSVGEYDLVKKVLTRRGQLDFWRVNVRPGKPLAFGRLDGRPFLGLPGNPVSALVTFELFVRPLLAVLQGRSDWRRPTLRLPLLNRFNEASDRRQYVRARLVATATGMAVEHTGNQGSAIQTSWLGANALVVVPENQTPVEPGTLVEVLLLR